MKAPSMADTGAVLAPSVIAPRGITVSLRRARPIAAQARQLGVDTEAELAALDLPTDLLTRDDAERLSLADYYRIQNRFSLLFGDETCHLSERQLLPGSTDFVLRNVGESRTLFDAMKVIANSYNLLHGGAYNSVVRKDNAVEYVIDDTSFPYAESLCDEDRFFSIESTLIFLHCMLTTLSQDAVSAILRLYVRRPARDGECGHLAYWTAPVRFGARRYRVVFDAERALRPMASPAPSALTSSAVYGKLLDAVTHGGRGAPGTVREQVRHALARGVVEQKAVAAQLGVSVATLRRRLRSEGVSFRGLRRSVLNETARRMLAEDAPIPEVAERLGFAEFRSFNRAFKEWNGMTPKAFVRQSVPRADRQPD